MKIGELAARSGLTASRIRFYEKSGLLSAVEREDNGYRQYGDEALWMLELIASAQSVGFSLDEIRSLLPDSEATWQHDALLGGLQREGGGIELVQQRLADNKAKLLLAIESVKTRPEEIECADRPRWLLNRLRADGTEAAAGGRRKRGGS